MQANNSFFSIKNPVIYCIYLAIKILVYAWINFIIYKKKYTLLIQEALLLASIATSSPDPTKAALADSLEARGHDRAFVEQALSEVRINHSIPRYFRIPERRTVTRSFSSRYNSYKARKGYRAYQRTLEDFVSEYEPTLIRAEIQSGVDYRAIAATIVHETLAGRFTATHGVLESLYTQFAAVPRRVNGRFGAVNQTHYLFKLAEKLDLSAQEVSQIRGSYAGAAGMGQFMPENLYYHYPASKIEDIYDATSAIKGVANYFQNYHEEITTPNLWQKEFNLPEQLTLEWSGNDSDAMIVGFLAYNKSAFYALMSYELTNSISRNEQLFAYLRREEMQKDVVYAQTPPCMTGYSQLADVCTYFIDVHEKLQTNLVRKKVLSHQATFLED